MIASGMKSMYRRDLEKREQLVGALGVTADGPQGEMVDYPADVRALKFVVRNLAEPGRWRRFCHWWLKAYYAARSFGTAWLGPRVIEAVYQKRQTICKSCDIRRGKYCSGCGCWRWPPAALKRKNRMVGWQCPLYKHPGTYRIYPHERKNYELVVLQHRTGGSAEKAETELVGFGIEKEVES